MRPPRTTEYPSLMPTNSADDADAVDGDVRDRLIEGTDASDGDSTDDSISDAPAGVTHPARKGGRVTDIPAVAARLTLTDETLEIREADGDDPASFDLRFADIIYLRDGQQEINGTAVESLSIRHVRPPAAAATTEVSLWDDAAHDRLAGIVGDYYRTQREAVAELEPTEPQLELLVRLYSLGGEMDPSEMLSKSAAELAALFDPLREVDLLRKGETGVFLTGRGYLLVNETMDDETM